MSRLTLIGGGLAAVIAAGAGQLHLAAQQPTRTQAASGASEVRALLDAHCIACHNGRAKTAGLTLESESIDVARVGESPATWEKVVRKLSANAMPPTGRPRPDAAASHAVVSWLETELDRVALVSPDPGRPTIHRLNRVEYANAVRDLFGLEVDVNALLPADDEHHGFDNIADVLSVSPTLIERYLSAAQRISKLVVGDLNLRPKAETYSIPGALDQNDTVSIDLPFGSRGGTAIEHNFPVDGEYIIRLDLRKQEYSYVRGLGQPHQLDIRIDGARVGTFTVGREWEPEQLPPQGYAGKFDEVYDTSSFPEWEAYSLHAHEGLEARATVTGGRHLVGISFDRRSAVPEGVLTLPLDRASYAHGQNEMLDGNPAVSVVQIIGPYNPSGVSELPSRERVFVCRPTADDVRESARARRLVRRRQLAAELGIPRRLQSNPPRNVEDECARSILGDLARRAYRRPTTDEDVDALMPFYEDGRDQGSLESFDAGIQAAIERILVDPEFLFRVETDPPDVASATAYRISDLELASRLSFFLWSSIPDDELLDIATRGELHDPDVLDRQIRRMLNDPRSQALVENFGAQWLQLRKLRNAAPDIVTYTAFDENLRDAMWLETQLFLEHELRENRPIVNLLRADYTFANERLAKHYGIPDVYGVHFRRVAYPSDARRGLLGHASILTVTSYANRTSPVLRGVWLLENFLGTPPSPPPADVPSLPSREDSGAATSVREQMQQHRSNPVCASCHNTIDPLGFALEEFDAIGRRRATVGGGTPFDSGVPIDASSTLMDGTEVHGLTGLQNAILNREEQFVHTVTEKLLTYALGRTLEHYDMPVVRQISRTSPSDDLTWSSLISGIIKSRPFLLRRSES